MADVPEKRMVDAEIISTSFSPTTYRKHEVQLIK
jgi:hypothetical protein